MQLHLSQGILNELEQNNLTTDQLINHLSIGNYKVEDLEFAVNKNVDGTIVIDSLTDVDLFGETGITIEVEDFEI